MPQILVAAGTLEGMLERIVVAGTLEGNQLLEKVVGSAAALEGILWLEKVVVVAAAAALEGIPLLERARTAACSRNVVGSEDEAEQALPEQQDLSMEVLLWC